MQKFLFILTVFPLLLSASLPSTANWSITSQTVTSQTVLKIPSENESLNSDEPLPKNPMQRKERIISKFQERIAKNTKKA